MKLDANKLLPWILSISIIGGAIYAYAQTSAQTTERNKALADRVTKCENKQESLIEVVHRIDKRVETILVILGGKK